MPEISASLRQGRSRPTRPATTAPSLTREVDEHPPDSQHAQPPPAQCKGRSQLISPSRRRCRWGGARRRQGQDSSCESLTACLGVTRWGAGPLRTIASATCQLDAPRALHLQPTVTTRPLGAKGVAFLMVSRECLEEAAPGSLVGTLAPADEQAGVRPSGRDFRHGAGNAMATSQLGVFQLVAGEHRDPAQRCCRRSPLQAECCCQRCCSCSPSRSSTTLSRSP